jgi:hypothetical protein
MPFKQLGFVGLGEDPNVGSPRGNGNYVNLGSNHHGTLLLASNLYMDDAADNLKVANSHATMAGAAIQIPGNGRDRQNYIEFWTTPPNAVQQGQDFQGLGDLSTLRVVVTPTGYVGISNPNPEAALHLAPHPGSPDEEVFIDASNQNPNKLVTAFTRLRAITSNGVRESQLVFGGQCSFIWAPERDELGGQQALGILTLLVNTDPAGKVTDRLALFNSDVVLQNDGGSETIRLDRQAGDVILQNADCAEDFDVIDCGTADPGSVMVLGDDGKLHISTRAYDRRVAGVVSGAGPYKPGLVLDRQRTARDRLPISLVGKAFCKVDAQYAAIAVGDLLTSSPTPGHAMRAEDPLKAFGAVLGKALRPLQVGQGMIPVLIALQ